MNVFTYGSLMFPEVWSRVAGEEFPSAPATLSGYAARRLRGQSYPILTAAPGGETQGVVYREVSAAAAARLDLFEGNFYRRITVMVRLENGEEIPAEVYAAAHGDHPDILPELWSAEEFERTGLQTFLREDPGFREDKTGARWTDAG